MEKRGTSNEDAPNPEIKRPPAVIKTPGVKTADDLAREANARLETDLSDRLAGGVASEANKQKKS